MIGNEEGDDGIGRGKEGPMLTRGRERKEGGVGCTG